MEGHKEIPEEWTKSADKLTEKEKRAFVFADNFNVGEWDISNISKEESEEWDIYFPDDLSLDGLFEEDQQVKEDVKMIVFNFSEIDYNSVMLYFNSQEETKEDILKKIIGL